MSSNPIPVREELTTGGVAGGWGLSEGMARVAGMSSSPSLSSCWANPVRGSNSSVIHCTLSQNLTCVWTNKMGSKKPFNQPWDQACTTRGWSQGCPLIINYIFYDGPQVLSTLINQLWFLLSMVTQPMWYTRQLCRQEILLQNVHPSLPWSVWHRLACKDAQSPQWCSA